MANSKSASEKIERSTGKEHELTPPPVGGQPGLPDQPDQLGVAAESVSEEVAQEAGKDRRKFVPKNLDPNMIITVRNGFQGRLVYRSKKTGERFVWDEFGAEQDMELSELKSAKSSGKKYFINNYFMIDDPEIIEYLGMSQYYKFALNIDDFDAVFEKDPSEMASFISRLSAGQKKSVTYRAKQLIKEGVIDSNRKISALEQCLGVALVER
jgi:hypothetical protein